ncbi:lysosomal cobalamin transporter ABCD4-like [Dermatophagoides farinae]|uniref:lysosomal cobalamin transporter ABCD4-like n=1 Tax=Dermatophagoides farinae TaxID=6954 RepID=UPI003F625313
MAMKKNYNKGQLIRHFLQVWRLLILSNNNTGVFNQFEADDDDDDENRPQKRQKKSSCLNHPYKWTILNILFLIFLSIIQEILILQIGLITARFYYVLLLKDILKFYWQLFITMILVLFMSLIKSFRTYVSTVIEIEFREHLTKYLCDEYFENFNYYFTNNNDNQPQQQQCQNGRQSLLIEKNGLDNVDQRLCQDLYKLCSECTIFISKSVILPFIVGYYSYKVSITVGPFGVFICLAIFLLSTFVNRFLLNSIVKWTYLKEKHEGIYRSEHNHIRNHCEHIAFTNVEQRMKRNLFLELRNLLSIHENLALQQFYLNFLTTIFDYSGSVISFIIISIPLFHGAYDELNEAELSRQISANTFICLYLINCFSRILDITSTFATINGIGYRLTELKSAFKNCSSKNDDDSQQLILNLSNNNHHGDDDDDLYLQLYNDTAKETEKWPRNFSLQVYRNENLFIHNVSQLPLCKMIKQLLPLSSSSIMVKLNLRKLTDIMFIMYDLNYDEYFLKELLTDPLKRTTIISLMNEYSSFDFLVPETDYSDQHDNNKSNVDNSGVDVVIENLSMIQKQLLNFLIAFTIRPKLLIIENTAQSMMTDDLIDKLYDHCKRLSITVITINNDNVNDDGDHDKYRKYHHRYLKI